jgi:hypothetical protein
VRDPYSYINSAFQQKMRSGRTFEQIIADPPLPLYRRIDSFFRVFGRDNVDIRIFDPTRFVSGDLIADFLAGIEAAPELAKELKIVTTNVALSHEAALLLNEINKRHPNGKGRRGNPDRADQIRKWLEAIPGQRFRCPRAALAVARPMLLEDLRWLHRALGERVFRTRPEPDDLLPDWSGESLAALAVLINDMAVQLARVQDERAAGNRSPVTDLLGSIVRLWTKATPPTSPPRRLRARRKRSATR